MFVIVQYVEEKQIILSFVVVGFGIVLVLVFYKDMNVDGVKYFVFMLKKYVEGFFFSVMWYQGNNIFYVRFLLEIFFDNIDELICEL